MKAFRYGFLAVVSSLLIIGCAHQKPLIPVQDEVLVYNLPYDLTYLKTLNALQGVAGWDLQDTVKESGLIRVRNINYSSPNNSDQREVTFLVKRIESGKTSIELAKDSQQVLGGGDLLKAVGAEVGTEASK